MWTLIVVLAFYQRGPQPTVSYQDFTSQETCIVAANATAASFKEVVAYVRGDLNYNSIRVQCVRK